MSTTCIGCAASSVQELLDLGAQPPSNRFLSSPDEDCERHPLRFGFCPRCGLAQLLDPMPPQIVRSRFQWITYNEPEGHLDDLVSRLSARIRLDAGTVVFGITYKDDSTLARFLRGGVGRTYRLDQVADLGVEHPLASLESIQAALTPDKAKGVAARHGHADVVLVRHILEHAHDPRRLVEACRHLAKPGGLLVFEMPDCRKAFDGHDHCFLWEEHIAYFTPDTLERFLAYLGFGDVDILLYPYPMEDSLIAIVTNGEREAAAPALPGPGEAQRLRDFSAAFSERKKRTHLAFDAMQAKGLRVALFGAGHLAAKFINFYGLEGRMTQVVDDSPDKQRYFMPGSGLPIHGSGCLDTGEVDVCLLTLNPESEQKVMKAKAAFVRSGGAFRSIFSASPISIDKDTSR